MKSNSSFWPYIPFTMLTSYPSPPNLKLDNYADFMMKVDQCIHITSNLMTPIISSGSNNWVASEVGGGNTRNQKVPLPVILILVYFLQTTGVVTPLPLLISTTVHCWQKGNTEDIDSIITHPHDRSDEIQTSPDFQRFPHRLHICKIRWYICITKDKEHDKLISEHSVIWI